jgi:hypothetical protein
MAEKDEKLKQEWIDFMQTNPTFGQFNSKVKGKFVSAELLYALWATKPRNENE